MSSNIPEQCWTIRCDKKFESNVEPFKYPRIMQAIEFIGLTWRYNKYFRKCKAENKQPHMDFFNPIEIKQIYGAPIGGIGTGSIGRSFSGDFCRFQLVPGLYEHNIAEPNMFTVCIRKKGSTVYQQALAMRRSQLSGFKAWNMAYSASHATYHALYPESWLVYDLPGQNVQLACHQISPILPHNYKDSSLPCAVFEWTIENGGRDDIELSLMFTWQAGSASDKFELTDVSSAAFHSFSSMSNGQESNEPISGALINQKLRGMPLEYCIAVKDNGSTTITYDCQFDANDEQSGSRLWTDLIQDGRLDNLNYEQATSKRRLVVAVCAQVKVKAGSQEKIEFSLVWNMPVVSFTNNSIQYKKFYTRYFRSAQEIASYALYKHPEWQKTIRAWQEPTLNDEKLPAWYKHTLFNELYFIADGGTVWFDIRDHEHETCRNAHDFVKEHGRFAYLEGQEYRMYNTYDVHFNASYALLKLWPNLQLSLQYDFADTIEQTNEISIQYLYTGKYDKQKHAHSLPHDIGDPENEPWLKLNAYNSHDTRDWRDLNLKFVLCVYRDYYHTRSREFLSHMWPHVKVLLRTVETQDTDNDGLIDSIGEPDQTYDSWSVKGASAYCGGLHVAALLCASKMAKTLGEDELVYFEKLERAKKAYDAKLWNGKYYRYDSSQSANSDSIMADMCCGQWQLRSSGFMYEAFDKTKIESCLRTIYEFNVIKYANGRRGAVNGMKPNGEIDIVSMQSEEVWIGINDALASLMIYEEQDSMAWKTLEGLYDLCYNSLGMAFQMPEALFLSNKYRSLGYMRPLCIWSVQYALEARKNI